MTALWEWRVALASPKCELSSAARHVGFVLSTFMSETEPAWPSIRRIQEGAKRSASSVRRALVELQAAGYLIDEGHHERARTRIYRASLPEGMA